MQSKKPKKPSRIGEYEPIECIGQGSMGDVWLCYDRSLDRNLVIKQMKLAMRGSQDMEERFNREVRVHAKLQHPHIVGITAYWRDGSDALNLAMEWVNGWTFRQLLDKHPRPPLWATLALLRECLSALAFAHDRGIVHRDLKPSNLMLGLDGRTRVLDFGIAKDSNQDMTQPGSLVGTTAYMSPEQARALTLTPQSDLFSLGIIAWELLGGVHPFRQDKGEDTLEHILNHKPSPLLPHDVPASVRHWVLKLLEKNPKKRTTDARTALLSLDLAMEGLPRDLSPYLSHWIHALRKDLSPIPSPSWNRPKPVWIITAMALLTGFAGGVLWKWLQ